jgi:far upstream element-binding protein
VPPRRRRFQFISRAARAATTFNALLTLPSLPTPAQTITESFEVPAASVGRLIGRSGETIRALQATTGTSIQVDHSGAGATKRVTISGLGAEAVARARAAVEALDGEEAATVTMDAPPAVVGRIIGRGGETIRALQAASEAHITLNQDFPPDHPRQVLITGRPEACERAQLMVNELMHGAPGTAQACIQRVMAAHGIGAHEAMTAPKSLLGRIIGRGGETVKAVQKATGATIQIDQSTDPCAITLAGQPAAVEAAKALISEVMNGGDPFGTGGGPGGWGGPGGGYGGGGGAPGWAAGGGGGYMMGPPQGGYMMPQGWMPPQQQGWAPPGAWGAAPQQGGYMMMPPQAQAGWPPGGGGPGGGYPGGGGGVGGPAAAAPAGPAGGGPACGEWAEYKDDQGRSYFYNNTTGVTQWERPAEGGGAGGGQ